jgi:predicted metal-dependent hydrolase
MFEKKPTGRVTIGTYRAVLDGTPISYTLKRGPRCRHARLEVARETGLTAIIPHRYDLKKLPAFLTSNKRWIVYALKKYGTPPSPKAMRSNTADTIPYLGSYIEMVRDSDGLSPVRLEGDKLVVSSALYGNGLLAPALEDWYRWTAEKLIRDKVAKASDRLGLTYRRIALKEMRTRWGSCSVKGNLNFNWKLVLMPEPVIDYVVIHELTHLKEMNHGKKFWALVEKECPDWRERRKWLTKNGREYVTAFERGLA